MRWRTGLNLGLVAASNLFAGVSLSLLAPFYPGEALAKGVSVTQSGVVLGSVFITTVVLTPIMGHYMARFGARRFLLGGSTVCALGNLVSGWLDRVEGSGAFFGASLAIRVVTAVGESAIPPAALTLATMQVEKANEGKAIALCETLLGLGTMFGASIGGLLYGIGGFALPFWVCGGAQLLLLLPCLLLLKDLASSYTSLDADLAPVTWLQVLRAPGVLVTCFALALAGTSWSWYQASLQPFLAATYGFSSSTTGLVFMVFGLTYTLATPLFGWLADRGLGGVPSLALGNALIAAGFLLLGPAPPLLPLVGRHAWLTVASVAVQGVGCAATYIYSQVLLV